MKVAILSLLFVGVVSSSLLTRRSPPVTVANANGLVRMELAGTFGLVCDNGNGDNIAKVACGGSGTFTSSGNTLSEDVLLDFSIDMTCKGDEASLEECTNNIQSPEKCSSYVATSCAKRGLRGIE